MPLVRDALPFFSISSFLNAYCLVACWIKCLAVVRGFAVEDICGRAKVALATKIKKKFIEKRT